MDTHATVCRAAGPQDRTPWQGGRAHTADRPARLRGRTCRGQQARARASPPPPPLPPLPALLLPPPPSQIPARYPPRQSGCAWGWARALSRLPPPRPPLPPPLRPSPWLERTPGATRRRASAPSPACRQQRLGRGLAGRAAQRWSQDTCSPAHSTRQQMQAREPTCGAGGWSAAPGTLPPSAGSPAVPAGGAGLRPPMTRARFARWPAWPTGWPGVEVVSSLPRCAGVQRRTNRRASAPSAGPGCGCA